MPELPDVETYKRYLKSTALQDKISTVEVKSGRVLKRISVKKFSAAVRDKKISHARRHGKHLLMELNGGPRCVNMHFGMTGYLKYYKKDGRAEQHDRIIFRLANGYNLAYNCSRMLGEIGVTEDIEKFRIGRALGPDALDYKKKDFMSMVRENRSTIKSLLMNQKRIAGIGNIYSDEILYNAKIYPGSKCSELSDKEIARLYSNMRKVLKRAIQDKADPEKMPRTYLIGHRKDNTECPRCGGRIKKTSFSGRGAYFCGKCQAKT